MNAITLIFAMLAVASVPAHAYDSGHQGTMHGKARAGHSADGAHALRAGKPGNPAKVSRTIEVLMSDDMTFTPARISVKRGETVKFVVRNSGKIKHEMVIGSMKELKQHAELMRKMPGMEHDEPNQVAPAPGTSGELVWQFTRAGTVDFACLQPGHFEAGMLGAVSVK